MDKYIEIKNVRLSVSDMQSVRKLVKWLNETLEINMKELKELVTGAVYCQLMHAINPRSIKVSKIYFYTNDQWHYSSNYKLLKKSFLNVDLDKDIPELQLQKGRGHYDFANWFYKLYQTNKNNVPYNALRARKGAIVGVQDRPLHRYNTALEISNLTSSLVPHSRSCSNVATVEPIPVQGIPIRGTQNFRNKTREYFDENRFNATPEADKRQPAQPTDEDVKYGASKFLVIMDRIKDETIEQMSNPTIETRNLHCDPKDFVKWVDMRMTMNNLHQSEAGLNKLRNIFFK